MSNEVVMFKGIPKFPKNPNISKTASDIGKLAKMPPIKDLNTIDIIIKIIIAAIARLIICPRITR